MWDAWRSVDGSGLAVRPVCRPPIRHYETIVTEHPLTAAARTIPTLGPGVESDRSTRGGMQPEAGSSLGRRRRLLRSAVALLAFSVVACAIAGVGPGETATDDGLSLSARSDHASVEPGGKV